MYKAVFAYVAGIAANDKANAVGTIKNMSAQRAGANRAHGIINQPVFENGIGVAGL